MSHWTCHRSIFRVKGKQMLLHANNLNSRRKCSRKKKTWPLGSDPYSFLIRYGANDYEEPHFISSLKISKEQKGRCLLVPSWNFILNHSQTNGDVSGHLANMCEILIASTKFLATLATRKVQFLTLKLRLHTDIVCWEKLTNLCFQLSNLGFQLNNVAILKKEREEEKTFFSNPT